MSRFGDFVRDLIPANEDDAYASMFISPNPFGIDAMYGTNIFTGKPGDPPEAPAKPTETLLTSEGMPSITDSDRRTASRKARASLLRRGGRASTILTDTDPLGGGL